MKVICSHCKETVELPNEAYNETVSCPLCGKEFQPAKEIAKTFPPLEQLIKTPAFVESLKKDINNANQNVSHADFVVGTQNQTMGIACLPGSSQQLIKGGRRTALSIFVILYTIAPLILVPLWAWHEHNLWLLPGIIISYIGTRIAANLIYHHEKQYSFGAFLITASIVSWFCFSIHSCCTFFALCALWGLILFMIADEAKSEYALQSLVENPTLFEEAIAQNKIMIVRKNI